MINRTSGARSLFLIALAPVLLTPSSADAAWADVRVMVVRAEGMKRGPEKERILRNAYKLAQESVRQNPNVSNEHLWLANAAGRLAQIARLKEQIPLAKIVRESAERAVNLDRNNAAAYMTLGAWHYYVSDVSWVQRQAAIAFFGEFPEASFAKAIEYLTQALRNRVENPIEVYWLRGCAYAELDRDELARSDFRACVAGTPRTEHEKRLQEKAGKRLK